MTADLQQAYSIALRFDLPEPLDVADFPEKGNINRRTFLIASGPESDRKEYILQQLNPAIFTQPKCVMEAMILCLEAQRNAVAGGALRREEEWDTIRLIPTRESKSYLEIQDGQGLACWRMMERIRRARSYKSLRDIMNPAARLQVAEQAGRGLALFGALTATMDPSQISCPLPGYRDTRLYYAQFQSVLAGNRTVSEAMEHLPEDPLIRDATLPHFLLHISPEEYRRRMQDPHIQGCIELALEQKQFALRLATGLESGELKKTIVHGDTKLENFLFDINTCRVRALVDMDTIMPHTWLSDWGDMMRSLINPAGERETDLNRIRIDLDVFQSAARGFLDSARQPISRETGLMGDAIRLMAMELGIRFLADYLRGDSYFMPGPSDPPELNRTRAMVQFRLFEELRDNAGTLDEILQSLRIQGR